MITIATITIKSSPNVIKQLLNADGIPDYGTIIPLPPLRSLNAGVYVSAEQAAKVICGVIPQPRTAAILLTSAKGATLNPILKDMSIDGIKRMLSRINVSSLKSEQELEQFKTMVLNFCEFGYFNRLDFYQRAWGTHHNAFGFNEIESTPTKLVFNSLLDTPKAVFSKLRANNPNDSIEIHVDHSQIPNESFDSIY